MKLVLAGKSDSADAILACVEFLDDDREKFDSGQYSQFFHLEPDFAKVGNLIVVA